MSESAGKAVFLSYASQDAVAATRICQALGAGGVEVWFDQSELGGGDAWDAKIKKQIQSCALFVPVISASTQQREEGYFRREWNLAVNRTLDMAQDKAFLMPVVIDDTTDAAARVPDKFREVQWTKLPGGVTSTAFVTRVQKLLAGAGAPAATAAPVTSHPGAQTLAVKPGLPLWATATLGAAVLALVVYFALRPAGRETASAPRTIAESKPAPAAAAVPAAAVPSAVAPAPLATDKSIAVLPFENMSDDKDNTAFFSDGMHEDILIHLSNIPGLRVNSRTSVMEYRSTTKKIPLIARELGVAYILEGSVRRAGNQLRITGQLIRAANDEHLWAKSYDRELSSKEIFTIQAALATEIAGALQAVISPETKKLLERRPTENLAAYDLWLQARAILHRRAQALSDDSRRERVSLLERAVALDPRFTVAWCDLSDAFGRGSAEALARSRPALDTALRLDPEAPEVSRSLGWFYVVGMRDLDRAKAAFEKSIRLQPNAPEAHNGLARVQREQGLWREALDSSRTAVQLDPSRPNTTWPLAGALRAVRRFEEALVVQRRLVEMAPDDLAYAYTLARIPFLARGSARELEAFFERLSPEQSNSDDGKRVRAEWAMAHGKLEEVVRSASALDAAIALAAKGNTAAARARISDDADEARTRVNDATMRRVDWTRLAKMEALLGRREEALRCFLRAKEIDATGRQPEGASSAVPSAEAFVESWTGHKEAAIAIYARLLAIPNSGCYVFEMRLDPTYFPLRGDPRFEALLNDPKNNTPLF